MGVIQRIKANPKLKKLVLWLISPTGRPKPRWWIRVFVNKFVHKRGKNSLIRWNSRMDVFPFNRFELGKNSTIESYCVINNGAGNVIIGDDARVGIGTVIIGPVSMGNGSGTGQHVFIGGFNHGYTDGSKNSKYQPLDIKGVLIEDEAHIGANSVVLAGVTIGKRTQIGAGSVVTKSIPAFCIAAGNPCKVIKTFNSSTGEWERISNPN
jgi:acetyltransferase-like isoleucine patch superfamily enzyme